MRLPPPASLLAAAIAAALLPAVAAAQQRSPAARPTPEQLLQVPVGGTHIPQQSQTQQLGNPYEGDSAAIAQGRALFHSMNCVGCHASQGGGGIGPPLSDNVWIYGGQPAQIFLTIQQGRPNGMPSFANALPPDDIWKLVAYVRTLSKSAAEPATASPETKQSGKP